jgi:hypothetical protein
MLGILACLFAGFFILNMYFRIKVFRHYRILMTNKIEFGTAEIFSDVRMQAVIDKHPQQKDAIRRFCMNMRFTMWMATVFVILVIILGFVLIRNR